MPRGIDTRHDARRQPPLVWVPREKNFDERPKTIEQGMETRAWKYVGKREDDED